MNKGWLCAFCAGLSIMTAIVLTACGSAGRYRVVSLDLPEKSMNYSIRALPCSLSYPDGRLLSADLAVPVLVATEKDVLSCKSRVIFRTDGSPVLIVPESPVLLPYKPGSSLRIPVEGPLLLDRHGYVKAGMLSRKAVILSSSGNMFLPLPPHSVFWLDSQGRVTSFMLPRSVEAGTVSSLFSGIPYGVRIVIELDGAFVPIRQQVRF